MKLSDINHGNLGPTHPGLHAPTSFKQRQRIDDKEGEEDLEDLDGTLNNIKRISDLASTPAFKPFDLPGTDIRKSPNLANI